MASAEHGARSAAQASSVQDARPVVSRRAPRGQGGAAPRAVSFAPPGSSPFVSEVKREVAEYFASRGLSDKANAAMIAKTVIMLALVVGPYALLISGVATGWAALVCCVVMGVGVAGVGFCVCHDAIHGAYSSRGWVGRSLGLMFDVLGASSTLWRLTHNQVHHTFTNLDGLDEDIVATPIVRFSPGTPRRGIHRWQQWFAWPLYSLGTLNWILAKDYRDFFRAKLGPYTNRRWTWTGLVGLLLGKAINCSWSIVLPLLLLDVTVGQFLLGFLAMHLTAGMILAVTFMMGHVVEGPDFPTPALDGSIGDAWLVHQVRTTADFARKNRLVTWYVGGLNYQIEHHLFPRVCSVHYPAISPIVEACARRHGIPYHDSPTLRAALASHWRHLKHLGRHDGLPSPA